MTLTETTDFADDNTTTETLSVGETLEGRIVRGDVDVVAVALEAGQNIRISQSGSSPLQSVTLRDADGNIVAFSPGSFRNTLPSLDDFAFQADASGTYFLTIESSDGADATESFDYSVTVTDFADDHGNFASNATQLDQGNNVIEGSFEHITDQDAFTLSLTEGQVLSLDLDENVSLETVTVLGPDGQDVTGLILEGGTTRDGNISSAVNVLAAESGDYTVIVGSRNGFFTQFDFLPEDPAYTLTTSVRQAQVQLDGDVSDTIVGAVQTESGNIVASDLSSPGDVDVFAVDLSAGQTLTLDTLGDFSAGVSLLDADGNVVAENLAPSFLAGGESVASELEFLAEEGGTFFISVANSEGIFNLGEGEEGSYFLDVNVTGGTQNLNGTSDDDLLIGTDQADEISGFNGNDEIFGGQRADIINGGNGADTLNGDNGADIINGGDGRDTIFGGSGADTLNGDRSADTINGGSGADTINGGNGADTLIGDRGADTINGGDGMDTIYGGIGADTLNGDRSADTIHGGNGDDMINGGNGADTLNGNRGADTLHGGNGADTINGNQGADLVYGGNGNDSLLGENGADTLIGGQGDDFLSGGNGSDFITGGDGNDFLIGGSGADTFIFYVGSDFDQIVDFEAGVDQIDLTAFDFDDFSDLNLVEQNDTVFLFIDEETSVELTGITDVQYLSADDFVL